MKYLAQEDVYRRADEEGIPISASMDLTYKCNLRCVHCYKCPTDEKELSYKEVVSVIDQLAEAGGLHLKFIGGEPLVRKDFFDIAFSARRRGFALDIFTNATLVTRESARWIARLYPKTVLVSLYGASEDSYKKVTGHPEAYQRALRGISYLAAQKVNLVVISHSFNFFSCEELSQMKKISESRGARWVLTTGFTSCNDGDPRPLAYAPSGSQLREIARTFPQVRISKSPHSRTSGRVCDVRSFLHVDGYGHVGVCSGLTSRDTIRQRPLMDIWKHDRLLNKLRTIHFAEMTTCLSCKSLPYCHPCPAANWKATGAFTVPLPAACAGKYLLRECLEAVPGC